MTEKTAGQPLTAKPPRGLLRLFLRTPIWLYRLKLGRLLGHRFLMLTHIGRKSGLPRHAVLEVVHFDPATNVHVVTAGWGEHSQWFHNVEAHPDVMIESGGGRIEVTAERLSQEQAREMLADYASHHPVAFRELVRVMTGHQLENVEETCLELSRTLPVIAFRPRRP